MKAYVTENAAERQSYVGDIFNVGSVKQKNDILNNLPKEWAKLHRDGYIHIHDLDAYGQTYNCLALNILHDFPYEKFEGLIDSRKISKLFSYLIEILTRLGNEQSGGMSFANFDIEVVELLHHMGVEFTKQNKEIIKDSIYNFIIWCNDCHTRMGQVSYYVSLNLGLGLSDDERFITYTVIDEFEHSPVDVYKPNIIFKVKDKINYEKGSPNYDLLIKALSCTTKKMIPTYLVCNSKTNEEFDPYKLAIMGCRTRVVKDLFGSDTSIGRGNIDNISINLPRLALESMNDNNPIESFYTRWDKVAETVKDILLDRFYKLLKKSPNDFKLNYERNLWCVDFDSAKNLEEIFKHGTLSIGFIGLSEAMEVLTGKRYYLDDETYKEAISFVKHMREYCDSLIKKYNLNFSLLATSGELISGRFLEIDKSIFSHKIFDKGFYTNSFHVNVDSHLSAFEKIKKEGVFHSLSNGGCISYVELGEAPLGNYEALYELLETAVNSGTSYLGFNFPLDICKDCNCQGVFNDVCPNCNGKNILRIRRVSGYLEILDYFTSGKKNETLTRQRNKWEE